jgi:phosphate starvation-inducible membrane PsiE
MNIWEDLISYINTFPTTNLSVAYTMRCAVTAEIRLTITSHKSQEDGYGLARYSERCLVEEHTLQSANFPLLSQTKYRK